AYTSGTTGFPKGVMHSHGLLTYQLDTVRDVNGYEPDDTIINLTPLFPLHGFLLQPAMAVHVGCTLLMLERFSPAGLAALSRTNVITTGTFVPAIVVALLQMPEEERPVFKKGTSYFVGGAPLHPEVRNRFETGFGVTLLQGYGSTEVMGAIAMERKERRAPWGSCGELWPGAEEKVRVLDDDGKDVAAGRIGEFAVHRSLATMGYWENTGQTTEAFHDGTWFRMGDLGRIDENGFVFLLDRKKDMIIRGGFNIYSAELERALNEHPAVAEATILGIPHDTLGEVPKAYIVLRPGNEPGEELAKELREHTVARLGTLKVPEEIEFVALEDLPRNAMGKVLKRALRERAKHRA
ncbi:MAG: class I adenylate-forming enzyme family protein, partial [Actinomycetota bacterium]